MKHRIPLDKQYTSKLIGKIVSIIGYYKDSPNDYYLSNHFNIDKTKFDWILTKDQRSLFIWPSNYDLLEELDVDSSDFKVWIEIQ